MRKFTTTEKSNGELAVRGMSEKVQDLCSNCDVIKVYEYTDDFDLVRYALDYDGFVTDNLSFEECEERLEDLADA